ncbi:MAG: hypothetical protein M1839_006575 [Geoglossum umbratile]|nr:MAG: hypothetical protein M1839_006575 [Geoglossum umbratile]
MDNTASEEAGCYIAATYIDTDMSSVTVMCRTVLFHITVSLKDLRGTDFEHNYSELVESHKNVGSDHRSLKALKDFRNWIMSPSMPSIQELAPTALQVPQGLTLQEYYNPPTYHLKLTPNRGQLQAQPVPIQDNLNQEISLNQAISPTRMLSSDQMISVEDLPAVPRFSARETWILQDDYSSCSLSFADWISSTPPQRVKTKEGLIKFFKPVKDIDSFMREFNILCHIADIGLCGRIRVPRLFGIVVLHSTSMAIGMLLDWIPGCDLYCVDWVSPEAPNMWKEQIADIVKKLHELGIVWGDVSPGNIVIDEDSNAWAIDFGGGSTDGFVDWENAGTQEGDWQGVENTFKWYTEGGC